MKVSYAHSCALIVVPCLIVVAITIATRMPMTMISLRRGTVASMATRRWAEKLTETTRDMREPVAIAQPFMQKQRTSTPPSTQDCLNRPPPIWPDRLKVVQRRIPDADSRVDTAIAVTYYDWIYGANLVQITSLDNTSKPTLWDLELSFAKHTPDDDTYYESYYFYPSLKTCKSIHFPVGILRPDWLKGASPTGEYWIDDVSGSVTRNKTTPRHATAQQHHTSTKVCGWTKADFIEYYADKDTGEPVQWYFHSMKASFHVLEYEDMTDAPTSQVEDVEKLFLPPSYCTQD